MKQHIIATKAAVAVLFVLCVLMTVFGVSISQSFLSHLSPDGIHVSEEMAFWLLLVLGYGCAAALLRLLWVMWGFLKEMEAGHVFEESNVRMLKEMADCCGLAVLLTAAIGLLYTPMLFLVTAAAGFMCLIIRVIRDAFAKAVLMKDELDLTI
ncbi:MAG: DUF2975 domain-containing protein [Lachnospiraceae bacterium]|nr:DUF2975 domain-containing protein [Lachnospiraceae bacterium]